MRDLNLPGRAAARHQVAAGTGRLRARTRRLRRDDGGGIGALVAILLGSGVLLGVAALVVDVGLLYAEQGRLQNGADAAALAVAKSCATGNCAPAVAQFYLGSNDLRGGSAVTQLICGSGGLGACPAATSLPAACPPPRGGQQYAEVTATATAGAGPLPQVFARALLGSSATTRTAILACAAATWGAPSAALATALTVPACAWYLATAGGTFYPPPPQVSAPSPAADVVLRLGTGAGTSTSTSASTQGCAQPGQGSFSWAQDQTGTCSLAVSGTYLGGSAASYQRLAPASCERVIASAQAREAALTIPVYSAVTSWPGLTSYQLKGFAAFVVTGYHLPGLSAPDWLNPAASCAGTAICVNGYFTRALLPGTSLISTSQTSATQSGAIKAGAIKAGPAGPAGQYLGVSVLRLSG